MTTFLISVGEDPSTHGQVERLIKQGGSEQIFLLTEGTLKNPVLAPSDTVHVLALNLEKPVHDLIAEIKAFLAPHLRFREVGLNLVSGSGKLHMAILSAVLSSGGGFRLVAYTKNGVEEL